MASSLRERAQADRSDLLKVWGPLVLMVIIGFAIAYSRLDPPPPKALRIASGADGGAYQAFAQRYQELLSIEEFDLEVVKTAGSIENLALLRSGAVDLALIQGGTAAEVGEAQAKPELEALASLFFEPLWVFYRQEIVVDHLRDLEGLRVAVGAKGSGTLALADELLKLNGIDDSNTDLQLLASRPGAEALTRGEVDALFVVSFGANDTVEALLRNPEIVLLPFRRHLAYVNRLPYLSTVILGEGAVDLDTNLPAEDTTLVASAASLVARKDLHHALIPLLLDTVITSHGRESRNWARVGGNPIRSK